MQLRKGLGALRQRVQLWRRWTTHVISALIAISLLLHILELAVIIRTRAVAREQVNNLATAMGNAKQDVLTANIALKQAVPIHAAIPVQQNFSIPISTTVAIHQSIEVPLNTPFGQYNVPVPLNFQVPVNTIVPIAINRTIDVDTTVNLDLSVPIKIPIAETSLADYLTELQRYLEELSRRL